MARAARIEPAALAWKLTVLFAKLAYKKRLFRYVQEFGPLCRTPLRTYSGTSPPKTDFLNGSNGGNASIPTWAKGGMEFEP